MRVGKGGDRVALAASTAIVIGISSCWSGAVAGAEQPALTFEAKPALAMELLNTIHVFGKRHHLDDSQTTQFLGNLVLDAPAMRKGGIGIVTKDVLIVLDEGSNSAIIGGKKWVGKSATKQEVLITDGSSVLSDLGEAPISKLSIIIFTPREVRFIDLSTNSGGKYTRFPTAAN